MRELIVKIDYDRDAKVWVTWHSEVLGLTGYDKTEKGLLSQIKQCAPELLTLNRDAKGFRREPDDRYTVTVVRQTFDADDGLSRPLTSFLVSPKPA